MELTINPHESKRDITLDNFKFILIAFVVIGHAIEPIINKFDWLKSLYVFIYLFHMPMFAYSSGIVSKADLGSESVKKIFNSLLVPYVFLEVFYSIFDYVIFNRRELNFSLLIPYWTLWYLFSLISWRVLLVFFDHFKFPIIIALIAGFAVGVNNYEYNLSFSRTFVFFPFFLLGYYKHYSLINNIKFIGWKKVIPVVIVSVIFIIVFNVDDIRNINLWWMYASRSYASLGADLQTGLIYRSLLYVTAFVIGISVFYLSTSKKFFFTKYGVKTLYIFVLHAAVIKYLVAKNIYSNINNDFSAFLLLIFSLLLLPILSTTVAINIAEFLMNPIFYLKEKYHSIKSSTTRTTNKD